jgi:hypothetical protein
MKPGRWANKKDSRSVTLAACVLTIHGNYLR